ncbi:ATP-dependent sacrificial sulfur transferase LarE [Methanoculleus chikugoensis]|uniref:Arginosuccinate synthase n=1 Tax=Methanoculleus chikugoensis TaxID=118126 RepID=A0ABM7H6B5_9EURY|nr:ATP-dependent sacrificial sulfur transferase LarE [Methanoculleus chikugoensis]BBL68343.1 arginosuccinate synthase [Methanoculleus chikugoensis]
MESRCSREAVVEALREKGPILIAYSGGVDSALLAALAVRALGKDRVRCVLLDSPLLPRREIEEARETAGRLDLPLEVVAFPILEDETFRANRPDRCYTCKKTSARLLKDLARREGIGTVADGTNASDPGTYRPGLAASDEEGVCHPLAGAGATKDDVRRIARECGFPFWNKPSAACLATRIPYGDEVTEEALARIEAAEEALQDRGFSQVRVRMHGDVARIEVPCDAIERLFSMRNVVTAALRAIGFAYVALDLAGYRSGSMDEVL